MWRQARYTEQAERGRWVHGGHVFVGHALPVRIAQRSQLAGFRRPTIGIPARHRDLPIPLIAQNVVRQRRRQGDHRQPQQNRNHDDAERQHRRFESPYGQIVGAEGSGQQEHRHPRVTRQIANREQNTMQRDQNNDGHRADVPAHFGEPRA